MIRSRLTDLRHNPLRQQRLWLWTLWAFAFLAVEKVLVSTVTVGDNGTWQFAFSLGVVEILCVAVYVTMVILIAARVPYIYLLMPDFVLLFLKLYSAIAATTVLVGGRPAVNETLGAVESALESVLFAMFLGVLLAGKLGHPQSRIGRRYPLYCMWLLLACLPVTVAFEIVKCVIAVEMHQYPLAVIFEFSKNVLGEALLDLPYYLMILMLCFVPQPHKEKQA